MKTDIKTDIGSSVGYCPVNRLDINSLLYINRTSLFQGGQWQNKLDVYIFCEKVSGSCPGAVCRRQDIGWLLGGLKEPNPMIFWSLNMALGPLLVLVCVFFFFFYLLLSGRSNSNPIHKSFTSVHSQEIRSNLQIIHICTLSEKKIQMLSLGWYPSKLHHLCII